MEVTVSFFVLKNNSVTKTIPKNIKRCSMKKIMILISVIFLMCTGIWFRFHTKECRVVSDLAYDKNKKGDHLVYIREGHELVPFLVLTSDYNGETLLLRKEVLKMNMQINSYEAYYENSFMDDYLNHEYIRQLPDGMPVLESEIKITDEKSLGVSGTGTKSIKRKIFLLAYSEAFEKIRNAAEAGETTVQIDGTSGALSFTADRYGMSSILEIGFDNQQLAAALGFTASGGNSVVEDPENKGSYVYGQIQNGKVIVPSGTDAEVTLTKPSDGTGFGDTATVKTDGNKITVTDRAGFEMSFLADAGYTGKLDFDVTDIGTMALHIGANEDQETRVRIPEVSCKSLYIDDADVTTVNGAGRGITQFDDAISKVSEVRSRLGAYQNRLESTVSSLDTFEENMTGAQSRLTDADMASEMTDYTHQNVLNQAAISVLTQANDLPQQVLQILQ